MSAPLSEQQLEVMRARAEKATPGPWYRVGLPWNHDTPYVISGDPDPHIGKFICDPQMVFGNDADSQDGRDFVADAEFIAAARADVPALLSEVERLKAGMTALTAAWRKQCADHGDYYNEVGSAGNYEYGKAAAYDRCANEVDALLSAEVSR